MPSFESTPPPAWMTVLAVDAMHFHSAKQALKKAAETIKNINKAEEKVARHQAKIDRVNELFREGAIDSSAHYDRLEPLAIQMESIEYGVGSAFGPHLQHLATVHVFAAAALEAHINIRGEEHLAGKTLELFDRLPLDAKWLFLPRLYGFPSFDPGSEPFQGFDRLIRFRNKLVHYRIKREPWAGSATPPGFLSGLGLSLELAERSLDTVKAMTTELAKLFSIDTPWWVNADVDGLSFFEIETEHHHPKT